jgi:hypothetical protein
VAQRAAKRYVVLDDGCWESGYTKNPRGYATLFNTDPDTGKYHPYYAHRAAYTAANGPIPGDLVVDHLCFNRACVNPAHLRLLTREDNNRRKAKNGIDWPLDECRWGHPLSMQRVRTKGVAAGRSDCVGCQKFRNDYITVLRTQIRLLEIAYGLGGHELKRSYPAELRAREARVAEVTAARERSDASS